MNKSPTITFCTGVGTVTGANFLLSVSGGADSSGGSRILIDCGMVQGERVALEENSAPFLYDASSIAALIVTHAHLDHVGRIPKLVKEGFKGAIYSTPETRALAELVLNDAVGIIAAEARQEGMEPLYGAPEVAAVFPLWKTVLYHQAFKIGEDISITLKDAGHILGSSMAEVTLIDSGANPGELKILFTGDLGNSPAPLLRDTETPDDIDYLVMESVYGDRNHEPKEERLAKLESVVKSSIGRGGTLVIPAFAIDRTQVILYELNNLVEQKRIPSIPVFVDSPMAIKATEIYKSSEGLFNDGVKAQIARGDDFFSFKNLEFTMTGGQSRDIENVKGPKIILAGSGMSIGGRVIGHEEEYLPNERNTILLVGYQTAGSIGRQLADGAKKVRIHKKNIKVKADIQTLYGYSAHKDGDHLVEFVAMASGQGDAGQAGTAARLKQVFVVMGEPGASMHLAQRLNDELDVKAMVPERGKEYPL